MRKLRRVIIVLVVLALVVAVLRSGLTREPSVRPGSLLVVDLEGEYVNGPVVPLLDRLTGRERHPLPQLLSDLRKAERDKRITNVLFRVRGVQLGWGKAQELRDAITSLRKSGHHTIAYLELETFSGNLEYYLASAADEVWLAPGTRAPLVGLAAEYFFLGGFFEKLGIQVEVERIGRFKTAADMFSATSMSDAFREMSNSLLDSIDGQFVSGIAERRGLSPDEVRAAIDAAPMSPEEFQARKLVDGTAFEDELVHRLGDPPQVEEADYARVDPKSVGFHPVATLAVVFGTGGVVTGKDSGGASRPEIASQTVSKALLDAAADPSVKAIVFRVDSPGGSALASDVIWRATQEARQKGKPLVVSMSDVAASGGYYISCGADAVVAEPGTLTGSIGVFVLRPVLGGLLDKLGIGYASLQRGAHADLLLGTKPLDPDTKSRLAADVKSVYDLFVQRVAQGRKLPAEKVDAIGQGRVWTGEQALELGLVDAVGGLRTAVDLAKEKAGLKRTDDVILRSYPAPKPLAEQIREALQGTAARAVDERVWAMLPLPAGVREIADWLASVPQGAPVLLPPASIRIR
jgi:protease-4